MGFDQSKYVELPDEFADLRNCYWHIRVRGRNQAVKRHYYRLIKKEQLRLVEMGFDFELIRLACKYYVNFKNDKRLREYISRPYVQKSFTFYFN